VVDPPNLSPAFRFANEMEPRPLDWLWPDRIPLGKLTLLIGDPGLGKSLLAADLAARVSAGLPFPSATQHSQLVTRNPQAGVLLVSPEDSPDDTLLPRLAAAGADRTLICILDGVTRIFRTYLSRYPGLDDSPAPADPVPLRLPEHLDLLAEAVRAVTVPRLLVLDPLQALLGAGVQSGPDRLALVLAGLADIARSYHVAVLAIGHLVKAHSHRMLYRARGSLAFVAAARCVHLLTADPEQPDRRILTALKTVYGPPPPPVAFRIVSSQLPAADATSSPSSAPLPTLSGAAVPGSAISDLKSLSPPLPPAPRLEWETADALAAPETAGAVAGARIPSHTSAGAGTAGAEIPAAGARIPSRTSGACPLPPDLLDLSPDAHSSLSEACDWLAAYLAAGPRPATDVIRDARAVGLSATTLRRAKRLLAVRAAKPADDTGWFWSRS
jgi:hypothetical protein